MSEMDIPGLKPKAAYEYLQRHPEAVLLDVRSTCEYRYVGRPIGAIHVPWKDGCPEWQPNPHFLEQVEAAIPDKRTPILCICRSGHRSLEAAKALKQAGYETVFNVEEGFEGPLDPDRQRSKLGGWRYHGLPWEQD